MIVSFTGEEIQFSLNFPLSIYYLRLKIFIRSLHKKN